MPETNISRQKTARPGCRLAKLEMILIIRLIATENLKGAALAGFLFKIRRIDQKVKQGPPYTLIWIIGNSASSLTMSTTAKVEDKKWGKEDLDAFLSSLPEGADVSKQYPGSCLCGGVRFYLSGEPLKKVACYCDHCRKSSGGLGQMVCMKPPRGGPAWTLLTAVCSTPVHHLSSREPED